MINFPLYNREFFGQSFFIIRKVDLPHFIYKHVNEEQIQKYSLSKINEEFNIYTSVIDLNRLEDLRKQLKDTEPYKWDLEEISYVTYCSPY